MPQYTFPVLYNGERPPHPIAVPERFSSLWRLSRRSPEAHNWAGIPGVVRRLLPRGWAAVDLHQALAQCVALWAPDPYAGGEATYWVTLDFGWRSWCLGCSKPPRDDLQQKYQAVRHAGWAWMMTVDAVTALQQLIDSHNPAGGATTLAPEVHAAMQSAREAGTRADEAEQQERDRPCYQRTLERSREKTRATNGRVGRKGPVSRHERFEQEAAAIWAEREREAAAGEDEQLW